jgi:hypothetical protein
MPSAWPCQRGATVTLEAIKRKAVGKALLLADGNITVAARELGVSRQSVYNYAKKYSWLDSGGQIDPNLVADARRCQEYWQPSELRDTPSKRERNQKRRGQVNRERMEIDMGAIRCGDSDRLGGY